jgi:hypothetical protein
LREGVGVNAGKIAGECVKEEGSLLLLLLLLSFILGSLRALTLSSARVGTGLALLH